ncbi:hypothetical protein DERP_010081 [Dermatophagoides pteronyssinus]|uniref:Lipase domain-containing protein n=1 Tax=Dermatophagoides pteronyssinus TaxID=6956 RepID=A0ABQ8JEV2_DERPT|nr:hypothetical protein DERP_010081 [Dermatophagoides pteronyssinus]
MFPLLSTYDYYHQHFHYYHYNYDYIIISMIFFFCILSIQYRLNYFSIKSLFHHPYYHQIWIFSYNLLLVMCLEQQQQQQSIVDNHHHHYYYNPIIRSSNNIGLNHYPFTTSTLYYITNAARQSAAVNNANKNYQPLHDISTDLFIRPFATLNSSFIEYLINDKIKLSRKLHLLLTILTQSNNTFNIDRHFVGDYNELISKNMATVLRKSLISKRKKNITATTLTTISPSSSSSTTLVNVIGRCFEPYGCFRITEPFRTIYRPINLIPEPPNAIKIAFYLRTRNNPTLAERLPYSHTNEFLISKYFRPESDLKIIIHGYLESSDEYWEMSMALLNHDDLNVISVDWMLGASPPYSQAVANTRLVGAMIAHLIKIIQKSYPNQFPSNRIHIIGHSLGAHVAGYIGEIITNLGHITGLDPAEPYFQYTDPAVRLDPNDAEFVDIIHSDVASIMSGGFGMSQSCGHVDFYPNGGIDQPGCKSQTSIKNVVDYISKEKNIFDGIRRFIGCNHARSFLIYIEAINSECPFMGFPCQNYDEFINGQCTSMIADHYNYQYCIEKPMKKSLPSTMMMMNYTKCPIRLGPNSIVDYKANNIEMFNDENFSKIRNFNISKFVYFLQTNDKQPFCHYHYNIKLIYQLQKNYRFQQPKQQQQQFRHGSTWRTFFDWPFNSKLNLAIIGSRNRITSEFFLKQDHFKEIKSSLPLSTITPFVNKNGGDLGKLLRIELDWRTTSSQIQRSLTTMPTKTLKKFISQLSNSETIPLLPSFLNELQRISLNVNQSQMLMFSQQQQQHQTNTFNKYRNNLAGIDMILGKTFDHNQQQQQQQNELTSSILSSMSIPTATTTKQKDYSINQQPLLRAIIVKKLETNEQTIFCTNEKEMKEIFQSTTTTTAKNHHHQHPHHHQCLKAINNKGNDHDQNESNNEPKQKEHQQQQHIEDEEIDSIISDYCTAFWQS